LQRFARQKKKSGEFGDLPIYGATHVKVVLLGEGFRARIPLWLAVPSGQAADCG
jgi:hypothetical protein